MTDRIEEKRIDAEIHRVAGGSDPFAAAVRATRMPMLITDPRQPDNPIVFVNDAFGRLTGYHRDETLGRNCRFLQGPDTDRADVRRVRDAIAQRVPIEVELLNYRKDGTTFWNRLLISPVFDGGELTFFFASQFDVTDYRMTEHHRDLLTRELSHRVKNTLATVQAIVGRSLREGGVDGELVAKISDRLQAIASAHDVLTHHGWSSADIGQIVGAVLDPFNAGQRRITFGGPKVQLSARAATSLALALHELATNAVKFGSLSQGGGKVSVNWEIVGPDMRLVWSESGGPAVADPGRRGFGSLLIDTMLASSTYGTTDLDYRDSGLVFTYTAPVEALVETDSTRAY